MPLGETLTLLATLANALQVLRTSNRATGAPTVEAEPAVDTMALMSFEFARTANESTGRRYDAACHRLTTLAIGASLVLLLTAFLGAVSSDSPEGSSPLFIASVCLFILVLLGAIALPRALGIIRLSLSDFTANDAETQWQSMSRFVEHARTAERRNLSRLAALDLATDALFILLAVQVVLAAVWLIS